MGDRTEVFERVLRLEPGGTALLVVDMQRGFLDSGAAMEVPEARAIVPTVAGLIGLFRRQDLPVVFSQFVYSPAAPLLVGDLHPEHRPAAPGVPTGFGRPSSSCLDGDPSAEVVPELAPAPGELAVRKHWYDAFAGRDLEDAADRGTDVPAARRVRAAGRCRARDRLRQWRETAR